MLLRSIYGPCDRCLPQRARIAFSLVGVANRRRRRCLPAGEGYCATVQLLLLQMLVLMLQLLRSDTAAADAKHCYRYSLLMLLTVLSGVADAAAIKYFCCLVTQVLLAADAAAVEFE